MPVSAASDLFSALERGDADRIIGTAESDWLDFKRDPYRLGEDDQKIELAKDLTALANSGGGVIVLGFATEREPTTQLDVARALAPVPLAMVNFEQYHHGAESLTYPPIRDLTLRAWLEQQGKAVVTIEVRPAREVDIPILVIKVREEGSRRELLFGIFQRIGDRG